METLNSILSHASKSDEEEETYEWEPTGDVEQDIKSLSLFRDFYSDEADRKLKIREVRDSYTNFDDWLVATIESIIFEEKEKDMAMFKL